MSRLHTPAPWQRFDNGGVLEGGKVEHAFGPQFADCVWGPKGPGYGLIADFSPNSQAATPESIANARIGAEAPRLLECLENLLIHLSMGWEIDAIVTESKAAVAAAYGETVA